MLGRLAKVKPFVRLRSTWAKQASRGSLGLVPGVGRSFLLRRSPTARDPWHVDPSRSLQLASRWSHELAVAMAVASCGDGSTGLGRWGKRFHGRDFVSESAMSLIAEHGGGE